MSIQLRRGTNAERALITPSEGELIYTTDTKILYVGDGSTLGGNQVSLSSSGVLQGQVSGDITLTPHRILGNGIYINSMNGSIAASAFNGTFNGSLGSNLLIGSKNVTNGGNLTINGGTGVITASRFNGNITGNVTGNLNGNVDTGLLSINGSTINSSNTFTSDDNNSIGKIYIQDYNQLIVSNSDGTVPYSIINSVTLGRQCAHIDHQIARNSLTAPARVQTGDVLLNYRINAFDGSSPILSSVIQFSIDNAAPVSSGHTPGKITLANMIDTNIANAKILSFDSFGRMGVNKFDATETLDVNGSGKFYAYLILGNYSTSSRNGINPVNGMLIYNRTTNRFQGYQNGAWINLDDGTAA